MVESIRKISKESTSEFIHEHWDSWFIKGLSDFISVPNLTPMVDAEYLTNGNIEKAIATVDEYVNKLQIQGLTRHIVQPEGFPPLVVYVIDGQGSETNLRLYGHLDKQPWMEPWDEGLGPTTPVVRNGKLYGRGAVDDGYAVFASMLAIKNLQQ